MIERMRSEGEKQTPFSLRTAKEEDLPFLFKVSVEAMKPVAESLDPEREFDEESEFNRYKEKFEPEKVEVIQYAGQDVGRLRVVRSPESIYVGGIQILPEFQGKGVGTALFSELIEESKTTHIPIILEVHDVNETAMAFYTKLGFVPGEKIGNQTVMTYNPHG